jgi:methyl-accepting chemotaxis protein
MEFPIYISSNCIVEAYADGFDSEFNYCVVSKTGEEIESISIDVNEIDKLIQALQATKEHINKVIEETKNQNI